MKKKRVLITGLAGFIGHHIGEAILKNTDWEIVGIDRLDSSGSLHRLADIDIWEKEKHRVQFIWHDFKASVNDFLDKKIGPIDFILHLAAGTHVDRSIVNPMEFVLDNVVATCNLLDYAKTLKGLEKFIYFSTDEVFGPAPNGVAYKEWDRYHSGNPYSATKAGGEELCLAYQNTFGVPVFITHCMNVFGERQHSEKYIPLVISAVIEDRKISIHSDKARKNPGSRFYIHARNVAEAILFLLRKGEAGDKYNIVGEKELNNLELAQIIASALDKPLKYELVDFHSSRPGHDLRYALDGSKLAAMGFSFPKTLEQSLKKTVEWYLEHPEWLNLSNPKNRKQAA